MRNYTPGPWRSMYTGRGNSVYFSVQATAPAITGFCGERSIKVCEVSGIDAETSRANSRLMAAAPDSHEANMEFVSAIEEMIGINSEHSDDWIYDEMTSSSLARAYFSARSAIAKVTGKDNE